MQHGGAFGQEEATKHERPSKTGRWTNRGSGKDAATQFRDPRTSEAAQAERQNPNPSFQSQQERGASRESRTALGIQRGKPVQEQVKSRAQGSKKLHQEQTSIAGITKMKPA